jgi:galactokinase
LSEAFRQQFQTEGQPDCFRAPGRVNLIGEHTDYNQGLVLPIALEMACYVAAAPASHGNLRVYSSNLRQTREWPAAKLGSVLPKRDWSDYVAGTAQQLVLAGYPIAPCDLYIRSEVPEGAGLSSSASLEVATALALLGERSIDKLELAKLCQRAESQFVGMPCGIMDQYASVFGQEGAAIQIDCRNLEYRAVKLPSDIRIIAVNSRVKHELGSSAYRERVAECNEAVAAIRKVSSSVESLRDVSLECFNQVQDSIPPTPRKRARHIITENLRVAEFSAAAAASDLSEMGRLFLASHRSMQHDYEISCEEIDFLVETAVSVEGVEGARMTGGGFGGCTVNLVRPDSIHCFRKKITTAYEGRFGITPLFYECAPGRGAGRLS